jgi:hypothetical protein
MSARLKLVYGKNGTLQALDLKTCAHSAARIVRVLVRRAELDLAGRAVVGRGPSSDLQIRDASVSGAHCKVSAGKIADVGSTNGTTVNGKPLKPLLYVELRAGDVVKLGDAELRVGEKLLSLVYSAGADGVPSWQLLALSTRTS